MKFVYPAHESAINRVCSRSIRPALPTDASQAFAAAAGAAAGAAVGGVTSFALSPELPLSPDPELPDPASEEPVPEEAAGADESPLSPAAPGFADEYPSLYHPPPLNEMAAAVIVRSRFPPQCGQTVRSASENFWIFSVRRWQAVHSYS